MQQKGFKQFYFRSKTLADFVTIFSVFFPYSILFFHETEDSNTLLKIYILSLEEIPEDELLAEKEEPEISEDEEEEKEDEEADEEKELEAEEKELVELEKDLEEENKEDENEKEMEEENKEDETDEKELEEEIKEDEIAEKDAHSANEGGIIFPDDEDKKEIPEEEFFHKDSEAGEPEEGFDEEENEKPGFVRTYFRKIKDFFKGLGK